MPVQTGFTADDDSALAAIGATEPPPAEVASADVVVAEAETDERHVEVRGAKFKLRTAIPGMLLLKLSRGQVRAQKRPDDPLAQAEAMGAMYDTILGIVVEDEQQAFADHCESVEPALEMEELAGVMERMIERVAGRPT